MNTDELIAILARDARPVRDGLVQRRLATFTGAGLCASLLLLLAWLPPRPDLPQALHGTIFWAKGAYTLCFALVGARALERLARPDGRVPPGVPGLLALAVALMAGAAVIGLAMRALIVCAVSISMGDCRTASACAEIAQSAPMAPNVMAESRRRRV